jgi:hypothetical protein
MSERPPTEHPDLEALSEWLDRDVVAGPDAVGKHVQACAACAGRLGDLRRGRDAVARAVPPLATARREEAIARALAAADEPARAEAAAVPAPAPAPAGPPPVGPAVGSPRAGRFRSRFWLAGSAAAAAVLVLVVASVALLSRGTTTTSHNTALSDRPSEGAKALAPAAGGAGDTAVSGGDLGDVPTVDVLRARVATGVAAGGAQSRAAPNAPAPNNAPVPNVVGTRVCEEQARATRPQLGPVVYAANLRFQGTDAVVLGFAATPSAPPATLLVLAPQEGCRLLAEVTPS